MKFSIHAAFVACLIFIPFSKSSAQQVTISTGAAWTDATIIQSLKPSESYMATTNYNTAPRISAEQWTHNVAITYRTLLKFDLSAVPAGASIQSASLYFNSDPAQTSGELSNQQLSGSNAFYLQRITSNWDPSTVTWNTQPTTVTTNRVWVPPSTSVTENIQVDVTAFIQDMFSNQSANYGIMMQLENELYYRSRHYASTNHANSALHPRLVINYSADLFKPRMDQIFGLLNQSYIPSGILADYGLNLADEQLYNGVISPQNELTMDIWRALYGSLLSAVINPSSNLIHLKTINDRITNYQATYDRNNPTIDLPVMFIGYQTLRPDALTQNLISVSNERLMDVPGRSQSPYFDSYAFAIAPSIGHDEDGNVTFSLRSDLFVKNSAKVVSQVQADFDDGLGYRIINFDAPVAIGYVSAGQKDLKFKIQFTDASTYYTHATFGVLKTSAQARYTDTNRRDFQFPRINDPNCYESFSNPLPSGGIIFGGTVTVAYGAIGNRGAVPCTNPQFIRPLIVAEGYDASKFKSFDIDNWAYDDFIGSATNGGINVDSDPSPSNNNNLNDRIQTAGYDLIFVDFKEGTGDIIGNAYLLENIIRWVNAHKISNPVTGLRETNVVLGQSMGGLVARYAVSDMEKKQVSNPGSNPPHEVRLLVTQDAPHRGANVPLGFQAAVNDLSGYKLTKIGLASYGTIGAIIGSHLEMRDVVPALNDGKRLLDEAASQQMLIVQDGRSNTFLDNQYRAMVTFSSAPSFQLRALSNGSECGQGQLIQPGGELLYADANAYVSRVAFIIAASTITNTIGASTGVISPGLGALSKAILYAFIPLTGKNWKTNFKVYAAPSSGTNQAYSANIKFTKSVFFIPINITLFNGSRNSIAGQLPWDSSPGGYYWTQELSGKINGVNINAYPIIDVNLSVRLSPTFTFVPTVSALDVSTSPLTQAALASPFTGGSNANYASRFSNFVTQDALQAEPANSFYNSRHIVFRESEANWFFNQLQGVNVVQTCGYKCAASANSPTVSGPTSICTENGIFSVSNAQGATSYNWTTSANLTQVSGQGTTSYTVKKNANGTAFVRVAIGGACDFSVPIQRDLSAGLAYSSSDYPVTGPSSVCFNQAANYSTVMLTGATNYSWFWPSNWTYTGGQGSRFLSLNTTSSSTSGAVGVRVATACDPGGSPATKFTTVGGCGFAMYPNPAKDQLTVESGPSGTDQLATMESTPFEIKILDKNGNLVSTTRSSKRKVEISLSNIPIGTYFIQINANGEATTSQLVISR